MSDLGFNKIAAAALATGLAILGLRELSDAIYQAHPAEKAGYAIAIAEEAATGGAPAELPPDWGTVLPTANLQAGADQSKKCLSCHTFTPGGANGTGPNLYGVVGNRPASHPGFAYSNAMVEHASAAPAWTYEELDAFIKAPAAHIPGTKMTFVGIKNQQDRINLIAWLRAQDSSPAPIPPPNPAAAAPAEEAADTAAGAGGEGEAEANATVATGGPSTNADSVGQAPQSGASAAPSAQKARPGTDPSA